MKTKNALESVLQDDSNRNRQYLTIRQIAKTGLLPQTTLRKLVHAKAIPFITVSKGVLIEYNTLCQFLELSSRTNSTLLEYTRGKCADD